MKEAEAQRYVSENMEDVFPGMSIIGTDELMLGRYWGSEIFPINYLRQFSE